MNKEKNLAKVSYCGILHYSSHDPKYYLQIKKLSSDVKTVDAGEALINQYICISKSIHTGINVNLQILC
jgi:hypothetical protein